VHRKGHTDPHSQAAHSDTCSRDSNSDTAYRYTYSHPSNADAGASYGNP